MLKVYGSEMCPDCIECKFNLDRNNIEYENKDITKNLKHLKEFLKLRDKDEIFDDAKDNGYIGIPALVTDEGKLTLDWESFFTQQGIEIQINICDSMSFKIALSVLVYSPLFQQTPERDLS